MSPAARITAIDAVQVMAAALHTFGDNSRSGFDDLQLEIRRALQWINHEQKEYWAREVRRSWDRVSEAKLALTQARTYRRVADHEPSCIDEKKALDAANRRLRVAQEKVEAVRRYAYSIDRAVDDFRKSSAQFSSWLEGDLPKALAALDRMTESLQSYVAFGAPAAPAPQSPAPQTADRASQQVATEPKQ
jgi:hypothetical protein